LVQNIPSSFKKGYGTESGLAILARPLCKLKLLQASTVQDSLHSQYLFSHR